MYRAATLELEPSTCVTLMPDEVQEPLVYTNTFESSIEVYGLAEITIISGLIDS